MSCGEPSHSAGGGVWKELSQASPSQATTKMHTYRRLWPSSAVVPPLGLRAPAVVPVEVHIAKRLADPEPETLDASLLTGIAATLDSLDVPTDQRLDEVAAGSVFGADLAGDEAVERYSRCSLCGIGDLQEDGFDCRYYGACWSKRSLNICGDFFR